jgi:hypothetical protein
MLVHFAWNDKDLPAGRCRRSQNVAMWLLLAACGGVVATKLEAAPRYHPTVLEVGHIVLCKADRNEYIHKVRPVER